MQALRRLVSILDLVAWSDGAARPVAIAREMNLPLSTVTRLMRQLADEELLHRSAADGSYALGPRVFALAEAGVGNLDIVELARPVLTRLRDVTGETASLHVRRGARRVCVAEVQSRHKVRRVVRPGSTQELCGTATGEVLLAGAPADELEGAVRRAALGPGERAALDQRLALIRTRRYALSDNLVDGLMGVAAPVGAVAAMSVSGPSSRFTAEIAEAHAPAVIEGATELSAQLARS